MMSLQAWSERVDCMHRLKARRIAAVCTETRFMGRSAEWKQELKDTCCDLTGKTATAMGVTLFTECITFVYI